MKKSIIVTSVALAVAAAVAFGVSNNEPEVELTPTQLANIEALTQGEGYVEYDKNCTRGGTQICVPNPFQIIEDAEIYP